ncbi:hypothetical protein XM38_042830 [Halomicronema hongdechloris C2206]|uniref:Uncharacterized protein n=1 Tax=Halomicronema hongdechloris C2206 TaxID=1641165 RepID=A0A1Z3HSP1_9CYAN|nr:hypothetical protein XM38_042830 [Halomicronema hongdechloris C2206]
MAQGIAGGSLGEAGIEGGAGIEGKALALKAVGSAAGDAVAFADGDAKTVFGQQGGTTEAADAAADDEDIGVWGHGWQGAINAGTSGGRVAPLGP